MGRVARWVGGVGGAGVGGQRERRPMYGNCGTDSMKTETKMHLIRGKKPYFQTTFSKKT